MKVQVREGSAADSAQRAEFPAGAARASRHLEGAAWVLVVGAVAATIWSLGWQNRELKIEVASLRGLSAANAIRVGAVISALGAADLSGAAKSLADFGDQVAVIAFATTTCPYCEETLPRWRELAGLAEAEGKRFILVSLDSPGATRIWAEREAIDLEIWVASDVALRQPVPTTAIVRSGVVQRVWVGTLRDLNISEEMLAAFRLLAAGGSP